MTGQAFAPQWPAAFGARPAGDRLARVRRSPHFFDGAFRNPVPTRRMADGALRLMLRRQRAAAGLRRPSGAIPLTWRRAADYADGPESGLRATWLGHATVLVEIDNRRVLFDPVWSTRCSPSAAFGPARLHALPMRWPELPYVDAVVISHDHYDHLDMATVKALARRDAQFLVPLGLGAHLERWGVPDERITELDWHESAEVAGLSFTATPARHYCNRGARVLGTVLWASWVVAGPAHRVFHSGDTGYFPGFVDLGDAYGPFDLTMMQVGAYCDAWPDVHLTPEEGVRAHVDLAGGVLLPIHWATFDLAPHAWHEPAARTVAETARLGVPVAVPWPGAFVEPALGLPDGDWWRDIAPLREPGRGKPVDVTVEASLGGSPLQDPPRKEPVAG
ncbi:MBL fold metallo-hydrolase [Yinghuangia sp. YIM S10712]|uniref:MBL fold metallo-hydrolase n=1 Tax=Yinghuangia sp. YIM S10712 TaxID=3436930 RepID=UPI003F538D2B